MGGAASKEVNILMMGFTGVGKSATANSILGKNKFVSIGGGDSVTKEFGMGSCHVGNYKINVVDIPGFADTDSNERMGQVMLVVKEVSHALEQLPNGFDSVLLVYPYTRRLTSDDKEILEFFLSIFDKPMLSERGVVVFSSGDDFRRENGNREIGCWIQETPNQVHLKWLIDICEKRCVLFDNNTDDNIIKENQKNRLMQYITGFKEEEKFIPRISRLVNDKERKRDLETCLNQIYFENIMYEMTHLECLVWRDFYASDQNVEKVRKQIRVVLKLFEAVFFVAPRIDYSVILKIKDTYDGSFEVKKQLREEFIKPFQLIAEKLIDNDIIIN